MKIKLKDFQNVAVTTLQDKFFRSELKNIVLSAPTGSGKTVMMISLMEEISKNNPYDYEYTFVWLTPGNGELEEQSWASASEKSNLLNAQLLPSALLSGFNPNDVTFINWELVKNEKNNIALKDGEKRNLDAAIDAAKEVGTRFVLVIDEEHRDQTTKAERVIERFNAEKIFRVSATPRSIGPDFEYVEVSEDDVIAEGMIVRRVELNPGILEGDEFAGTNEYFLKLADEKRLQIKKEYVESGLDINPLVLIQFPDEKGKNDSPYMIERGELIHAVEDYLITELGQNEENIARWLSGDHFNIDEVQNSNSKVNYLLMKQAISTGWDAPRAKVLVKLRLNTNAVFTLQTIGRIRRMPEQKHYNNSLLDSAFVFSNDEKYVAEVMNQGAAHKIATYMLNPNAPDFQLVSLKPTEVARFTTSVIIRNLHEEFIKVFTLGKNTEKNKQSLIEAKWDFSQTIKRFIAVSDNLSKDIAANNVKQYEVKNKVDLKKTRFTLLDREQKIMKALPVSSPSQVNDIMIELFSWKSAGSVKPPILKLNDYQLRAFIINNYLRIAEISRNVEIAVQVNLFEDVNDGKLDAVKFILPNIENYAVLEKGSFELLTKNVYIGYSTANHVKPNFTEQEFEKWLQQSKDVLWWYRSSDRGREYFSIPVGIKKEGFFPDYLVQGVNKKTYILETKYFKDLNPSNPRFVEYEQDAHAKFEALKSYIREKNYSENAEFAFVQPVWENNKIKGFFYNNSEWDANVSNSHFWKKIDELFK